MFLQELSLERCTERSRSRTLSNTNELADNSQELILDKSFSFIFDNRKLLMN